VYCLRPGQAAPAAGSLADGDDFLEIWQPRGLRLVPRGMRSLRFSVYSLFHHLRIFRSRDYALLLVRHGERIVHHSCVNPPDFRFPFMADDDLQIGDVETSPDHRGSGIASSAISAVVARPGRTFWWIAEAGNAASIRAVEKVGFLRCGTAERRRIAGVIPRYEFHGVSE
jgi:RimJ/RimL family protein N-acetyltransferase